MLKEAIEISNIDKERAENLFINIIQEYETKEQNSLDFVKVLGEYSVFLFKNISLSDFNYKKMEEIFSNLFKAWEILLSIDKLNTSYGVLPPVRGGDGSGAPEFPQYPGLKSEVFYENKNTNEWKSNMVIFAHVCGYFTSILKYGKAKELFLTEKEYLEINPGIFYNNSNDLSVYFQDKIYLYIQIQLLLFAESVKLDDKANEISQKIFNLKNQEINIIKIYNHLNPYLVHQGKYNEVIRYSLKSSYYLFALKYKEGKNINSEIDIREVLTNQKEDIRKEADLSAAYFSLIPIMFELSKIYIKNPEEAKEKAKDINIICQKLSDSTFSPEIWNKTGELVEMIFSNTLDFEKLSELAAFYASENSNILKNLCLIGACSKKTVIPENQILMHIICFLEIAINFRHFKFMYRNTFISFFIEFWNYKFTNTRFRFKNPRDIELMLNEIEKEPQEKIIQKLLENIFYGLNVNIDKAYLQALKA